MAGQTKEEKEKARAEKVKTAIRYLNNLANALGVEPDAVAIAELADKVVDELE